VARHSEEFLPRSRVLDRNGAIPNERPMLSEAREVKLTRPVRKRYSYKAVLSPNIGSGYTHA
jgi:hypothetical protein